MEKQSRYFDDHPKSRLILLSENDYPRLEIKFGGKHKKRSPVIIEAADFIAVKGFKAKGKRLSNYEVATVTELEPIRNKEEIPVEEVQQQPEEQLSVDEKPKTPDTGDSGEQMSLF
jgi:topoisomerase-4 subunit A